jgi:hypothetical protein
MEGPEKDLVEEATALVSSAAEEGVPIRLMGGLAVRILCPEFPAREAQDQDVDLASVSSARTAVTRFLTDRGFVPDRSFNALYGQKQLYFTSPDGGRALDVILDQLNMCHVLDFRDRIERMPHTLDPTDLLLSKLQIVELNEKDVQDALYLLAAFPVRDGDEPGTIGLDRVGSILGGDWGWWRTVTRNLKRMAEVAAGEGRHLIPPNPSFDPIAQTGRLGEHADATPKSLKWRLRSVVGDRVPWYKLPEEVTHD